MYDDTSTPKQFFPAAEFRDMAERIERNSADEFAGAFLIVLRNGETISGLLVDPQDSPAMLLANASTKIDMLVRRMEEEEAHKRGGFR